MRGGFLLALAIAVAFLAVAQPISSLYTSANASQDTQVVVNQIVLTANPEAFNIYNTNGTPPFIRGTQAVFYGSDKTDMYQDIASKTTLKADKTLVLAAQVTTNIKEMSNTGADQFAIFAADDTTTYKGDEFGFVLPKTGSTWYAYIQSPELRGWFFWTPVLKLESSGVAAHSFKAVYSNLGLISVANFYVDGKLV